MVTDIIPDIKVFSKDPFFFRLFQIRFHEQCINIQGPVLQRSDKCYPIDKLLSGR